MRDYRNVFFDTAPLIYYFGKNKKYSYIVKNIMNEIKKCSGDISISDIGYIEFQIKPYQNKDFNQANLFNEYIKANDVKLISLNEFIIKELLNIAMNYPYFKIMDLIQLATAKYSKATLFVTNDKQLSQFKDIDVLVLDDFFD